MYVLWDAARSRYIYFEMFSIHMIRNLCWVDDHELSSPVSSKLVENLFGMLSKDVPEGKSLVGNRKILEFVKGAPVYVVPAKLRRDVYFDRNGIEKGVTVVDNCDFAKAERLI